MRTGIGNRLRPAAALLALLAALCAPACRKEQPAAQPEAKAAEPAVGRVERGPVTVTLRAEKAEFSIADNLRFTCTVEAEPDVDVQMPQFGENLGEFLVKDYRTIGPEVTADKKNRWRQEYELEVYVSGKYKIPPLAVKFIDRREGAEVKTDDKGEPEWNELRTEELTVEATSIVEDPEQLTAIKDIAGPQPLPREAFLKRFGLAIAIFAAAAVLAGVAVVLILRKREAKRQMLPAHVIAFRMLEWLIAQDFVRQGRFEEFYVRLCGAVRAYIELRFGIHAREETTEEFLALLSRGEDAPGRGSLLVEHRALLKGFLEQADLVKFARHQPDESEIQKAFDAAKSFIQSTVDETVLVEAGSVAAAGGGQA